MIPGFCWIVERFGVQAFLKRSGLLGRYVERFLHCGFGVEGLDVKKNSLAC